MEPERIPFRIERTRNRHSRALLRADTVVIRLARNLSPQEEQKHIDILLSRMKGAVLRERKRTTIDPFRPLLEGAEECTIELANGNMHRIVLHAGSRTRIRHGGDGTWNIEIAPNTNRRTLHRLLWQSLCDAYREEMTVLTTQINEGTIVVHFRDVRLRFAVTQWGSCSPTGTIMLNPALLFLPAPLMQYVIIHELAHRVHANHSRRFWLLVEQALPNAKILRRELRRYRLPAL
jgi:predicted metal-dependent hydrolase